VNRARRIRVERALLFAAGLGLTAWFVAVARTAEVLATLRTTAPWLPVIVLVEIAIIGIDVLSMSVLVGHTRGQVPARMWLRGAVLAYASSVLLPAGRAAGEAVRAAVLAPFLGIAPAARACASLQGCALVANAVISLASASVSRGAGGPSQVLALALCGNALVCAVLAIAVFAILASARFAQWVERRFPRFAKARLPSHNLSYAERSAVGTVVALCMAVRLLEAVEYGVILRALGSPLAARSALTAQGIHLVGAAIGDFIPNHMGVTEGSYLAFAGVLGLAGAPARALSIALTVHVVQLALAIGCLFLGTLTTDHPRFQEES
jgi:hypothetical protein